MLILPNQFYFSLKTKLNVADLVLDAGNDYGEKCILIFLWHFVSIVFKIYDKINNIWLYIFTYYLF